MTAKRKGIGASGKEFRDPGAVPAVDSKVGERRVRERRASSSTARKKAPAKANAGKEVAPQAKGNVMGTRMGYNPYESGHLIKPKNPGIRRDLRVLGSWLKEKASKKT